MVGDGLCVLHVRLAVCRKLGVVVTSDTSVVDEDLDSLWFFLAHLIVETLYIVLLAG